MCRFFSFIQWMHCASVPFSVRNAIILVVFTQRDIYINLSSVRLCFIHSHKGFCLLVQDSWSHSTPVLCRDGPGGQKSQKSPRLRSRKRMCTESYHSKHRQQLQDHSWADKLRRPTRHLQVHGTKTFSCNLLFTLGETVGSVIFFILTCQDPYEDKQG